MFLRQHWKESANLIVLTPSPNPLSDETDYSVLTIRGSADSNLHGRSYVTPGGTLDSSDFSAKWWQLFDKFGLNSDSMHKHLSGFGSSRPPIITDNLMFEELRRSTCDEVDLISTDMALRIAAIRHLFIQTVEPISQRCLPSDICDKWRQKVSQSSDNFFQMCDQLELKPDLFSLKEWWNWLTPSSVGRSPRFDTIYYICCVNNLTVNESQFWTTPQKLIERRDGYFLAPPQIYELSRVMNFKCIQEVEVFATEREKHGIHRWLPVVSLYSNGAVALLPGDDLYPDCVELVSTKPVRTYPQRLEEMRTKSDRLNRMELRGTDCQVVVNTDMPLKHIRPVSLHSHSELKSTNL